MFGRLLCRLRMKSALPMIELEGAGTMLHEARSDELIDVWTLVDADWRLVANKHGATRLGFALLLKFFESEARFPEDLNELPAAAVAYVAEQVKVPPAKLAEYG